VLSLSLSQIRRGKTEPELIELIANLRQLMCPYTALNFKEDAHNRKMTLSHYATTLTTSMGLTHILSLSQNESKINLRIARTPTQGPTLTFQVTSFSLMKHVKSIQRRPVVNPALYLSPPVVITNNFGDVSAAPHVKLMRITFQNMFPVIHVANVKLSDCRRVVLFNYIRKESDGNSESSEKEDEIVEVRHYAIKATPVGLNRKVRRIIQAKIPNLSKLDDISDYITGKTSTGEAAPSATNSASYASDSEPEDETSHVTLPQSLNKNNKKSTTSALKLVELGPRLRLKLYKVERGLSNGDVMYHAFVKKTAEEAAELKKRKESENTLKKRRREEQEANVAKKMAVKEEKREGKRRRKEEREKEMMDSLRGVGDAVANGDDDDDKEEDESSGTEEQSESEEEDSDDDNEEEEEWNYV